MLDLSLLTFTSNNNIQVLEVTTQKEFKATSLLAKMYSNRKQIVALISGVCNKLQMSLPPIPMTIRLVLI